MAIKLTCNLRDEFEVAAMLQGLTKVCEHQLRKNPGIPRLYDSGVRYMREPPGREWWQTVLDTLRVKNGDCEDLAAWRTAELRVRDGMTGAEPAVKLVRPGLIHCVVLKPGANGAMVAECPSRILGMKGKG